MSSYDSDNPATISSAESDAEDLELTSPVESNTNATGKKFGGRVRVLAGMGRVRWRRVRVWAGYK